MEKIKSLLPMLPYWRELNERQRELIAKGAFFRRFEQGEHIHGGFGQCYILRGCIRVSVISAQGREISLFRLHSGELCVLSASTAFNQITFDTYLTADTECELLAVSVETVHTLMKSNVHFRCFMYELLAERFSRVMPAMQEVLFMSFDQRLAAFFVREHDRTGLTELYMTHDQIAQQTSSVREVVARRIKMFAAEGLVETRRGAVRLIDIPALRALMCK